MIYIYLDNFRGFKDQLIPIRNVNFLVGENSTGKTSLLSLICILESAEFWYLNRFWLMDFSIGFRTFDDICSKDESNEFRIALLRINEDEGVIDGFVVNFRNIKNQPSLTSYTYINNSKHIQFFIRSKVTLYKELDVESIDDTTRRDKILRYIHNLLNEHRKRSTGYAIIKNKGISLGRLSTITDFADKYIRKIYTDHKLIGSECFSFFNELTWFSPIRTQPQHIYEDLPIVFSPEGKHTPIVIIKNILPSKKLSKRLEQFGANSGLYDALSVKKWGGAGAPFEIEVNLKKHLYNIVNVGYGVSQILPIITEIIARKNRNIWFSIQQPEIHLHPKAQAAFGELILSTSSEKEANFLIETHSDFIIDRFCLYYKELKKKDKLKAQVIYFENQENKHSVFPIEILENGKLTPNQPTGYREFFIKESLQTIDL